MISKQVLVILFILFVQKTYSQYYVGQNRSNFINLFDYTSNPNILPCTSNGCISDSLPLNKVASSFQLSVKLDNRQDLRIKPHLTFTYNGYFQVFNSDLLFSKKIFNDYKFELGSKFRLNRNYTTSIYWLHWSNGEDLLSKLSRSSDQVQLLLECKLPKTKFAILTKIPIPKRHIQNSDLFKFQGYVEFSLTQKFKKRYVLKIKASLRTLQTKLRFKISKRFWIQLFRSSGYSDEQIINYNNESNNIGIGFFYN